MRRTITRATPTARRNATKTPRPEATTTASPRSSGDGRKRPHQEQRRGPRIRALRLGILILLGLLATGLVLKDRWRADMPAWLADMPQPLVSWPWLDAQLAEVTVEPVPLEAAVDGSAFAHAEQIGTEAAYRSYLDDCDASGCRYRAQAEARIAFLQRAAAQDERETALQRREDDLDAYRRAISADTEAAYRRYLEGCAERDCGYRRQAQERLVALQMTPAATSGGRPPTSREASEQAARATELEQRIEQLMAELDRNAFDAAKRADTQIAYLEYLDSCSATGCWHRKPAEARLAQLTDQMRRFKYEPEMVPLEAGCVQMASPKGRDDRRAHRSQQVCVDGFKIAKHEVTFSQYDLFARVTGRAQPDDQGWGRGTRPVINVSWEDATAYAAWLSEQTGRSYRLPTEAEWAYAAHAGTETARYWGDSPEQACAYANVHDQSSRRENELLSPHHSCDDGYAKTAPVGQFQPNPWGLYDMLGNVWEWTCSTYGGELDGIEQRCAAPGHAGFRSIRGGSWHSGPRFLSSEARSGVLPDRMYGGLGFRLVED